MRLAPQAIAPASARHRRLVIGIWTLLLLAGGLLGTRSLSGALSSHADFTNAPESKQAQLLLEQRLTGPRRSSEIVIVQSATQTVDTPTFRAYVQQLQHSIRALGPAWSRRRSTSTRPGLRSWCRPTGGPPSSR